MNKAVEVLGMGGDHLRMIPVGDDYRIDIAALERQLEADKQAGYQPICIVGNAGTVNTGAIDPLDDLLRIARREALWFHVDGAFGAVAGITEHGAQTLAAMREADSLAFDLHKWFYVNYEVGCVLIRDREIHRKAFVMEAAYLTKHERGLPSGPETYSHYGLELSRGFKALKVWMSFKEHGLDRYREIVARNIDQARYLANLVQEHPKLELLAPVTLNIVCFRYLFEGDPNAKATTGINEPSSLERLNELNRELLMRLHESGEAVPSYTVLQGRYGIRVNITNHRTRYEDLDRMIQAISRLAESVITDRVL
jgi:glutamate/tyrosine decarboxylase-like PLP-dependent enzyme